MRKNKIYLAAFGLDDSQTHAMEEMLNGTGYNNLPQYY